MRFMNSFRDACRWLKVAASTLIAWLLAVQLLWAQAPGRPGQQSDKNYSIQYFLVMLGCVLGLLIVCRSAHRTTEIKRTDD
jgi:hypothetical protein